MRLSTLSSGKSGKSSGRGSGRRTIGWCAAALVPMLALSACLQEDSSGGGGGTGDGVPADASKQDYIAAFENLDSETITIQTNTSPGEGASVPVEALAKDLDEWSGGKLTVEIAYGNSVAAPDEVPQALAEGRIDMDYVYPLYDPSRFPKNAAYSDIAFVGDDSPEAGVMSAWAGLMEAGLNEQQLAEEFEGEGLKMLLPFSPNASVGLLCSEPQSTLADLDGAQVRVSGGFQDEQVAALGASPVSLPYSEQYQALQRGTIDCAATSAYASQILGLPPIAPNFTTGAETGFARVAAPYAFGSAKWDSLALPYQQLIYDRVVRTWAESTLSDLLMVSTKEALDEMRAEGGEIQQFDDGADAALEEANEKLLDQLGQDDTFEGGTELAADAVDAVEAWQEVAVEMGYSDAPFAEWAASEEQSFDTEPFVERFWEDVASEHRPE